MELTDGVVVLRPPTEADEDGLVAAVRASAAELAPWLPWATPTYGSAEFAAYLQGSHQDGSRPLLLLEPDGTVVGGSGLSHLDPLHRKAELGYWVRSDRTGRGYATRATRLTARWAVEELGFERIAILMSVENEPSRAVARRAGASYEGVLRCALQLHGRAHDAHCYSLVASDVRSWASEAVYV